MHYFLITLVFVCINQGIVPFDRTLSMPSFSNICLNISMLSFCAFINISSFDRLSNLQENKGLDDSAKLKAGDNYEEFF